MKIRIKGLLFGFSLLTMGNVAMAGENWREGEFRLASNEFKAGETLPISAISEYPVSGSNACSINGATGGNLSPELHWEHAPADTRSFVIIIFDATASVVHWGMYNIAHTTTSLPQNAGVADSRYGLQVTNFASDQSYDGPCPPPGVAPDVHQYIFTVYALDEELNVYAPLNFPPSALTLYRDLLEAGRERHILASATLLGVYSTTPPSN